MKIMTIPVAVATEDNKVKCVLNLELGGDSLGETFRIRVTLSINGEDLTILTEPMCRYDLKFVEASRAVLASEIRKATESLWYKALGELTELQELMLQ